MARSSDVTPWLTGDPVRLETAPGTPAALLAELGLAGLDHASLVRVGPRVVVVCALTATPDPLALRWVSLPAAARFPGEEPAEVALVLTGSIRDGGRMLSLVGRHRAVGHDAALLERAAAATTRAELVSVLAPLDRSEDESPLAADDVFALLGSGPGGLTAAEADRRLRGTGPNRIERVGRRSLAIRLLDQFASFFALLLWTAGAIAFVAGLSELGAAVLLVIAVNGLFGFVQEYRSERAVAALEDLLPREIGVVRDGRDVTVPASAVVPGDVVRLREGDQVPADGQLLAAEGLRIDQSALTGEPEPVLKFPERGDDRARVPRLERHELAFAGTSVVAGEGTLLVTASGMATEIGDVARLTQAVAEQPSPLQREMARVTRVVTGLAVGFGVAFFGLGVASGALAPGEGLLFALGVIVANVPEGLLPTLTLALALGAQRLARQRSLIKRLSAVETLGATTVICTDKTGTLTESRMTLRSAWVAGEPWTPGPSRPGPPPAVQALLQGAVLACHATRERGDPTEVALVQAAESAGIDAESLRSAHPLLAAYPFESFRKRMTLVRTTDTGPVAFVKGAPRQTLALCDAILVDGRVTPLTPDRLARIRADHDRLAAEGLRLLAVARRTLAPPLVGAPQGQVERELTLLGLVALWDPPRPEVAEAMALCRRAGIRVIVITGDDGLTGQAITRRVGLVADTVVTGDEVDGMGADALRRLVAGPGILFARMSPAQKLAIVQSLRALGEVVAVTGDGVNDAPALKAADIGVSMGRRGTEVAREASAMVVTDDNFASIVAAIRQGRAIYANMGKFVTYIFASNIPELVPFLAFVLLGIPLPLTVMQILAVDLGTDLVPALALGAEPPEAGVMDQPPRPRDARLLGPGRLLHAYGFLGAIEALLALGAFFWTYRVAGWRPGLPLAASGDVYRRATTMTLAGIVAAQVGNVFACRTERESVFRAGFWANPLVFGGVAAEVGILLLLMLVPPFPHVFGLAPLALAEWRVLLVFPVVVLALEEGRKWIARRISGGGR
jgi:calcium-translocating P-type ATPase